MRVCVAELPRAGKARRVLSHDGLTPLAAPRQEEFQGP